MLTQVAEICRRYNVGTLIGDRYAYVFARELLRDRDMGFRVSDKTTSACFSELAPMLNASEVLLPRHPLLLDQIGSLERKPSSRGREFIGHPPGGHDDLAAAVAVAAVHCAFRDSNQVHWFVTGLSFEPGGRSFETSSSDYIATDPDVPTVMEEDYPRMKHIRNTVRINGQPMTWKAIREKVAEERKWL